MITAKFFLALLSLSVSFVYGAPTIPRPSNATPTSTKSSSSFVQATSTIVPVPTASPTPISNVTTGGKDLQTLYDGNTEFRSSTRRVIGNLTARSPSFMFLGCTDNRISAGAIFNAPAGSIISQNNIANQYLENDMATHAAVTYAIQDLKVQHVIVLGHYGCKGVEAAIVSAQKPSSSSIQRWVQPISNMFLRSPRSEIKILRDSRKPQRDKSKQATGAPPVDDPGFKALVEENVKQSVEQMKKHSVLSTAYRRKGKKDQGLEVYVHGFVYDESSGEVNDLRVSFGPPGKQIPPVPFTALEAAKNWHKQKWMPKFDKGKNTHMLTSTSTSASAAPAQSQK